MFFLWLIVLTGVACMTSLRFEIHTSFKIIGNIYYYGKLREISSKYKSYGKFTTPVANTCTHTHTHTVARCTRDKLVKPQLIISDPHNPSNNSTMTHMWLEPSQCVNHLCRERLTACGKHAGCTYHSMWSLTKVQTALASETSFTATMWHCVTCRIGSHSVTCHPTQVNMPCLNPSQAGQYSIYLPWRDGRLSWPRWLVI